MEDLPNYDNFTGPGTVLYQDLNPWYNDFGESCYPFDYEWDFLHLFDGNSLDFDWVPQPMGSLSMNQPPVFATEPWPSQLDMSLIGNLEVPALPVDLEQPLFPPPMTFGNVQSFLPATPSNLHSTRNVSASPSSISRNFLPIPSAEETPIPAPFPQSLNISTSSSYTCSNCPKSKQNPRGLKYVLLSSLISRQPP
jgi:hypothetical protein